MQSPPPIKLHWFPMEPTWIVSLVVVVFAALPHQLPIPLSFGLRTSIGRLLGMGLIVAIGYFKPVLGMALFFLLVTTNMSEYVEGFAGITTDTIKKKGKWFSEDIMGETPEAIQERTDELISCDNVQGSNRWHEETTMGEFPKTIQERTSPTEVYQESHDQS
jgi:hypothetical protein